MELLIGILGIVLLPALSSQEFGYLFPGKDSYIQTKYSMLCADSVVKLEVFINRTAGVLFYAENRAADSTLLVYFNRPGIYLNATLKGRPFDLPLTLDFFNSKWFGWHDMEIRVGEKQLGLGFDGSSREGVFDGRDMFPEDSVEENFISFGLDSEQLSRLGQGFEGMMRNYQYRSCDCTEWKPVQAVVFHKVSVEFLGDCRLLSSCAEGCSCVLFPWGTRRCDCPGPGCPSPGNDIYYRFNVHGGQSDTNQQLKHINGPGSVHISIGKFHRSFLIHKYHWMVLAPIGRLACFKSIFFCDKEFYYQIWLKPGLAINSVPNEELVLKHASSLQSPYGLEISRTLDRFRFTFTTGSNHKFQIFSDLPILLWNRITVAFDQTTLRLFLNQDLIQFTSHYTTINYKPPKVITTKYLFVGMNTSNPHMEIDSFYFSTSGSVLQYPSVQILRLEQYRGIRKMNKNCDIESSGTLINLAPCYKEIFGKSNFSLGYYMSMIFGMGISESYDGPPVLLVKSSFFHLNLMRKYLIELTLVDGTNLVIPLKRTCITLCYLEISVTPENIIEIFQDIDTLLHRGSFDLRTLTNAFNNTYLFINGSDQVLKEMTIMNMGKDLALRSLRIPAGNVTRRSVDFDDLMSYEYAVNMRSKGYVGYGMELSSPGHFITLRSFDRSCVRNIDRCYYGLTITFRLQVIKPFENSIIESLVIFSSGNTGLMLLLDNYHHFILIIRGNSVARFIPKSPGSLINQWSLVELSISSNRMFSLLIDNVESFTLGFFQLQLVSFCSHFCLGNETLKTGSTVLKIDEIDIWDVGRDFLYANHYISQGTTLRKLYSFSNYQLNTEIALGGSAEIIPTNYGQGIFLNGFGPRFASATIPNDFSCLSRIDNCRRGIMIKLWLRIDKFTNSRQIFVSGQQFVIGSDRGTLFVHMFFAQRFWFFGSDEVLPNFLWQQVIVSWRKDSGMKIFVNDKFVGHVFEVMRYSDDYPIYNPVLYIGKYYSERYNDDPTVLIDDLEFYEADRNSLAFDRNHGKDFACFLRHSFDANHYQRTYLQLGIIGNAGIFYPNITTERKIRIPPCFNDPNIGRRGCFTLRFWIYMNIINTDVLETKHTRLHVSEGNLTMDIVDFTTGKRIIYVCIYDGTDFIKEWNFFEFSWDPDEGLLAFVNRDLLPCKHFSKTDIPKFFSEDIEISYNFNGAIDELELFMNRLPSLYWNNIVDEKQIYFLLQKLRDKRQLKKDLLLANKIGQRDSSSTINLIQSFEFNGTNYLKYKILANEYTAIPGRTEEIKVSFKSFDNSNNKTIMMIEDPKSLKNLSIKNQKLYFTIVYLRPPNDTRRLIEELAIHPHIETNVVYDVVIRQKVKEIVLNITSTFVTRTQSMIGRETLLPGNSMIYLGGHEKRKGIEFGQPSSSFIGVIHKAQVRSIFKREAVDIIKEISEATQSNPDLVNYGDVKANMKPTKVMSKSRTALMEAIVDRKIPITINDPFASIVLPTWNSEIILSFEAEFRTLESRGLLLFVGNATDFVAVEIFDGKLFFQYKSPNSWKRVTLEEKDHVANDNSPHSVYVGRDINGNMKVFLDRKEVLSNLSVFTDSENSFAAIGYFGSYRLLPREIMSKTGFVGCIEYVGINDMGYLDMSRWILSSNQTKRDFGLPNEFRHDRIVINGCSSPSGMACQLAPCHGGSCEPTSIGGPFQSAANYICDCLYSSRTLNNNFTGLTAEDNFNTWISNYLWRSRSRPCSEDTSQIVITEKSLFSIDFNILFPINTMLDLEFMLYAESLNCCIASLSGPSSNKLELIVIDGFVTVKMSNILELSVPDIIINNGKWHGVRLQMRYGLVKLKIDHIEKTVDLLPFPVLNFSNIILGQCSRSNGSSFRMKNFMYNSLNVLQYFYGAPPGKLFYQTRFIYPYTQIATFGIMSRSPGQSVTFLNNFRYSLQRSLMKLSWINEIEFQISIQNNSGSFVHLTSGDKFLSVVICDTASVSFIYKDGSRNSQRLHLPFQKKLVHGKIIIDLLKGVIEYYDIASNWQRQLTKNVDSWNIGKHIQIQFGLREEINRLIIAENSSPLEPKCLSEAIRRPFFGCVRSFTMTVGREVHNMNNNWTQHMESYPPSSVLTRVCKDVEVCLPTSCVNGVCRSINNYDIFCDCSSTNYMGDKCHLPKPQCDAKSCQNHGACVIVPDSEGLAKKICLCEGTGFTGPFCEKPVCRNESCLNNGTCYISGNSLLCNCSSPIIYGDRCQYSLCNSTTCNNHGSCFVNKTLTTVVCICDSGYLGDRCEIQMCRSNCINGGICSSYIPAIKLCSAGYCEFFGEPRCSCDLTLFRGETCELPEFGFDPSKDGLVIMDQIVMKDNNYLRILIEPLQNDRDMVLFHLQYSANHYFYLFTNVSQLWLRYQSESNKIPIERKIGDMEKVNILLIVVNRIEIRYYFNSEFGIFPIFRSVADSMKKSKRSVPSSGEDYPRITLGSNADFENSFVGLIAGFQWNGRDIMNNENRVRKDNTFFPISKLHTRTFPRQNPHMLVPKPPPLSISVLTIVGILQCLIFMFYIVQKNRPRRSEARKIDVYDDAEPFMVLKSSEDDSDKVDKAESIISENIVSTLAMMSSCPPQEYIHGSSQIVLVDDLMSVQHLVLSDLLIIPGTTQIALVLNHEPTIQICQKLFPLDATDMEYRCVSIRATEDYQYAYCHVKSTFTAEDDLVELLVWEIAESWRLVCRPPNISFTSSVSLSNIPSHLLIMNRHSYEISIWRLDMSVVIWSTNLSEFPLFPLDLTAIAGNEGHIFIGYDYQFHFLSLKKEPTHFQIVHQDFPFSGRCQQLVSIENNNFLLRTESQELYLFDTKDQCFRRLLEKYTIFLIAKLELWNQTYIAMAMDCGQIYVTSNIESGDHCILGPKNINQVVCISFSPDASVVCAGYENNLIHVWRVTPDISLCHFHAVHESNMLRNLYLTDNARYIIAVLLVGESDDFKEHFIQIIKRK